MEKVLVLHGFASIGKPFYDDPEIKYITPTFDYTDVEGTLKKIDKIISEENIDVIVGKSTGGWYAMKYYDLYGKYGKVSGIFVINPLLFPDRRFSPYVVNLTNEYPTYKNYYTGEEIIITKKVIDDYQKFEIKYPFAFPGMVFLGEKDDVLNPKNALIYLEPKLGFEIFSDEGHRFSEKGIEKVNNMIREFLFRISIIEGGEDFE